MKAYKSNFAFRIEAFLSEKRSLGFLYEDGEAVLYNFDCFCIRNYPNTNELTQNLVMDWAVQRNTESSNSFRLRLQPIREFGKFLNRKGECAYILPTTVSPKRIEYIPYIYSKFELKLLFEAIDSIPSSRKDPFKGITLSTMIRLIYCCGLRPKEARLLKLDAVNFTNCTIFIKNSKGYKDRLLPVSPDVVTLLKNYDNIIRNTVKDRTYFFSTAKNCFYSKDWLKSNFRKILKQANLINAIGNSPRLYDMRHTFATNQLIKWHEEGKDLRVYLPILSEYLGHADLSCTSYYIHLSPQLLSDKMLTQFYKCENLIPEVPKSE